MTLPAKDGNTKSSSTGDKHASPHLTERLKVILDRASMTSDDICCLFALFVERSSAIPKSDSGISKLVGELVKKVQTSRRIAEQLVDAILLSLALGAATSLLWGFFGTYTRLYVVAGNETNIEVSTEYAVILVILTAPAAAIATLIDTRSRRSA